MVVHVSGCDDGYNPRDLEVSLEDVSKHLKMFLWIADSILMKFLS